MRTLKTIVITLGALLIAGFGMLIYGLSHNWHKLADAQPAASAPAPARQAPALTPWGRVSLGLSPDSRIQGITRAGRVVVVQVVSNSDERLVVLDPATGAVVGTFLLGERP